MKTLNCPDSETLNKILLGCSEEVNLEDFENHLASCEVCRSACEAAAATDDLIAALQTELPASVDNDLPEEIARLVPRLQELDVRFTAQPRELDGVDVRVLLGPAEAPDEIGRFAGYRVMRLLGQGGMGLVFSAEDPSLKRLVALKILNPVLAASRIACRRFEREAQAAAAFEHDHIITIYHVGEESGLPFFAMQLLEGESLQDRLDCEGQLSPQMTQRIGRQIASGLAAAHDRGLLHRDIKPDNIWLQQGSDRVKILDFGLVQLSEDISRLTDLGAVIGTPAYMAPEQANGTEVDRRCDLFSLGTLMYRCVTGVTAFRRESTVATLVAVAKQDVRSAEDISDCPQGLSDVIVRLMQKEVESRPTTAAEVVELLSDGDQLTHTNPVAMPKQLSVGRFRLGTWLIATCAAAAAFLLTVIIQIKTDRGMLQVKLQDDQFAASVEGQALTIREVSTGKELKVRPGENSIASGEYEFLVQSLPDGVEFSTPRFSIFRGRKKLVEVSFVPKRSEAVSPDATALLNAEGGKVESASKSPGASIVAPLHSGNGSSVYLAPEFPVDDPSDPIGPGALVSNPTPLPGVAKWTVEPKHDAVESAGPFLSDNGQWLAAVGREGSIRVWATNDLSNPHILYGHRSAVTEIQWSPVGTRLVTASRGIEPQDGFILIRQTEDWTPTHRIDGNASQLSWSHSGNKLAFLTFEAREQKSYAVLNVFDVSSGQIRSQSFEYKYQRGVPKSVSGFGQNRIEWSPDDRSIALSRMKTIRCVDAASLQIKQTLNVEALDFRWGVNNRQLTVQTPPHRELSQGDNAEAVITAVRFEVWDIETGKLTTKGHEQVVTGNHTIVWNHNRTPLVVRWPQRPSESDDAKPTHESRQITLTEVGSDHDTAIDISDDWNFAAAGVLKWSSDQKVMACLNVEGLYLRREADESDWNWVADTLAPGVRTTLRHDASELWLMRTYRNWGASAAPLPLISTQRIHLTDLRVTSAITPDYLPAERAFSPDRTTLAEFVFEAEKEQGSRWSLKLTPKDSSAMKSQTFPLPTQQQIAVGNKRLLWSADSSILALVSNTGVSGGQPRLFKRSGNGRFEENMLTGGTRHVTEASFSWNPKQASFAWATDKGPAIFNVDGIANVQQLPLGSEFDVPERWTYEDRIAVNCYHWVDEDTLFGGVSGRRRPSRSLHHHMGYIWKRDHDTRWRIAAKFVGHAFSDSFLSPAKTRIAYADADDKKIHVANLASGLMETFAAVTDPVRIYRKPVVAGWLSDDLLALSTGRHSSHHIGTLDLDSGITNWRQASGAFAFINGSFFCSRSFGIESYNPNLQRQSTIAVSSRGEAARIFPNGSFESNLDDPCELLFVVETPDGTSNTLTQPQFEDRFGRDAMVPSPAD